jgi:hypothetical protein
MSMPQSSDFVWTWNFILTLFLTVVILPAIAKMIVNSFKRHLDQRDMERSKKDEQIAILLAEKEANKEAAIREWRGRFEGTLCSVKKTVEEIKEDTNHRVYISDCKERHAEIWDAVDKMRDKIYK